MNLFEISNSSLKFSSFPKKNGTFQNFSFQKKNENLSHCKLFLFKTDLLFQKKLKMVFKTSLKTIKVFFKDMCFLSNFSSKNENRVNIVKLVRAL